VTEETAPERPVRRAEVPAGVFAPDRRPPFVLFTAGGDAARLDDGWLDAAAPGAVYLSAFDLPAFLEYLRRHLHAILASDAAPLAHRAWALHRTLLAEAHAVIGADEPAASAGVLRAARELAALVRREPQAFGELNALLGGAYSVASHAVATAIVAVALAAADGVDDVERLAGVALGGLFADAGKLEVGGEALARRGPLTPAEWERMLQHPRRSAERMRSSGVVLAQALRGALHHHERWDGAGYPDQQRGPDIPMEARYVAIADAFSAMTTDRPYRARRTPYDALTEMVTDGGYEPRLLRVFVPLLRAA
jgi:HD-GYP domain-containing protein (c-di-GMP phosphodiesterase class II)